MRELFDIVVEYRIEFPTQKPFIEGEMNTVATSDYDAENWVREYWEAKYPDAYIQTQVKSEYRDDDPFILK